MKEYDKFRDTEKLSMLTSVANLYYYSDMTQNEIAERFYTSRSKISRMLKQARELGIVEITVREPWDRNYIKENKLKEIFPLNEVRVINVKDDNAENSISEYTAYYLDNLIDENTIIGTSWGTTMDRVARAIKLNKKIPLQVVPIMGVARSSKNVNRPHVSSGKKLAVAYGGEYHYMYAPLFVKSQEVKESIIKEPEVQNALSMALESNLILTSVGSISAKSWEEYLSPKTLDILERKGAVGHIGGHFYDISGKEIPSSLSERIIGLSMEELKGIKNIICIIDKENKAEAVIGAIRTGIIDNLIISSDVVTEMFEIIENRYMAL